MFELRYACGIKRKRNATRAGHRTTFNSGGQLFIMKKFKDSLNTVVFITRFVLDDSTPILNAFHFQHCQQSLSFLLLDPPLIHRIQLI